MKMRKYIEILGYTVEYNAYYSNNLSTVEDIDIFSAIPAEGVNPDWAQELYNECCDDDYEWADNRVLDELTAAIYDEERKV